MKNAQRKGKKVFSNQSYSVPFPLLPPLKSTGCFGYNKAIYNRDVKKFDSTWNGFCVFFLQFTKKSSEKNNMTCQSKMHYPKLSGELAVSRGICYCDTNIRQTSLDVQIKLSAKNPGRCLFKNLSPFIPWLSIWEDKNFPKPVHAQI